MCIIVIGDLLLNSEYLVISGYCHYWTSSTVVFENYVQLSNE